ncbi:TM0106 family RecB-like putative nuclease [Caulobacter sp. KR2-114]|uniref:TM0106 family RecB-like putative nuclease n=1 Tax=Caulobacter sp. KR2-114 TaxID=3400912 RepID=UPI003C0A8806
MTKLLSASRLNEFLGCQHRAALWLDGVKPDEEANATLELVRAKGFDHEAQVLDRLAALHGAPVEIATDASLEDRVAQTLAAMADGAPLIYQGAFANDRWVGFPDFLIRETRQEEGITGYAPEDAKLARAAKAEHVVQLGIYGALIADATGYRPRSGVIHVGQGEPQAFELDRTRHITRRLMADFETFADADERPTRPLPSAECARCGYAARCEAQWRAADSPTFVAGLATNQMLKLEAAGVTTLAQLAGCDPATPIGGIGAKAFERLASQARLQHRGREEGRYLTELLPPEEGRGFDLLPAPAPGDLFFDMEGDPLYPEGLEYLFGLWGPLGADGTDIFHPIWAHDRAAEKRAFEALMDLFTAHLDRYPQARIYHYAPYETVALKRLAMRHATREAELDDLLRDKRFVDLYQVVRQSIRASTEGYSLKDLEKIYWGQREGEVTNAGDSIVEYERWRETGEQAILDSIGRYNEDDCVSTARMRDWLETLRPANGGPAAPGPNGADQVEQAEEDEWAAKRRQDEAVRQALKAELIAAARPDETGADLLGELLWFHQRAQKPQWWAIFDRQTWSEEDLIEDFESIGGAWLDPNAPVRPDKRSLIATYRFEPQDTKLKEGDRCRFADGAKPAGVLLELDVDGGWLTLRRGLAAGDFPERASIIPGAVIDQDVLIEAVKRLAARLASGDADCDRALLDLITRRAPRIAGVAAGDPMIPEGVDLVDGAVSAALRLDRSYLPVQGPPGTGKTYTASMMILALLKAGKRVGVTSNAHKAINNLLEAVEARAAEQGFTFQGCKKGSQGNPESYFNGACISTITDSDEAGFAQLVGGTAFHFARPSELGAFDVLVVDEAGQVALGNLAAMSGCARNIILVGDQMQLPQPVQGTHPGQSGLSCLDYLMQDHATVPPERGILLDVSRRMRPEVCSFISEAFYEGRLEAHTSTTERALILHQDAHPALKPAGISVVAVPHEANRQTSPEEADVVAALVASLVRQQLRLPDGTVRRLTHEDILVVAPFNAQVHLLRRMLPAAVRVGTVDRFQGQEAAVAIVSMATSNGADAPRGTGFLFSRNRLNVALSRAQCLAILVRGEGLLELAPATIGDLERLDAFAFADEAAG